MKSNYNDCLNRVLKDEGGYTNDPRDPGGPTNYGITLADYRLHINKKGTANDVKDMSIDDAKSIYKSKYWDALDCDSLSSGVDYTVFDYGVNSGVGRARKVAARFKGLEPVKAINAINDERLAFLKSLSTWSAFGRGWGARVAGVRTYSTKLAQKTSIAPATSVGGSTVGLGAIASQYWHNHETLIIVSAIVLALAIGTAVHMYLNKGK